METKLSKLVAAALAGDWQTAIRIAARFPDLGEQRDAIKRAHEVQFNPAFYQQLGFEPEALFAAGVEALKARYPKQLATLIEGTEQMTDTKLSAIEIAKLTATVTGGGYKRANSKDAAIKRLKNVIAEKNAGIDADKVLAMPFDQAASHIEHMLNPAAKAGPSDAPNYSAARAKMTGKPVAKVSVADAFGGDPLGIKAARKAAAPKPEGKRAAIVTAAERGEMPTAPDFSAETHKSWRKKLAEVVALVEAGDIAGLKANTIEPKSSSRKAICNYRDLAIKALEAKASKSEAA